MRVGEIDLPEPLLDAQQRGELVVFAGAGVSVAPPSNYPQLKELAARIGEEASLNPQQKEPLDRFLGRLRDEGVNVHERLGGLLTNPESKPSSLHYDLLKLFSSAPEVRLVTTNFDTHFNAAAEKVFDEPVTIYYAPALPLGYRVDGIVYLHGSVAKDPNRIVLTDGDFGRAYLTEGWSRRFLQDLFTTYTVLFVGYSHNDPVMNYLARGLPPEVRGKAPGARVSRYALTPSRNHGHWDFLGIEPVTYPLVEGENPHRALAESVAEWARISRMGEREHEHLTRQIAEHGPPAEGATADYLRRALRDRRRLSVFASRASKPEWLAWADQQGLLDPLFAAGDVDETNAEIARWFVIQFAVPYPEEALAVVSGHGGVINPALWDALAQSLASHKAPRLKPSDLARWVAVLLHPAQHGKSPARLMHLLESCDRPEDDVSALLLFEYLARPYLGLEDRAKRRRKGRLRRAPELWLEGDPAELEKVWERLFQPRLGELSEGLGTILTAQLGQAELLLSAARGESWRTKIRSRSPGLKFLEQATAQTEEARGRRPSSSRRTGRPGPAYPPTERTSVDRG